MRAWSALAGSIVACLLGCRSEPATQLIVVIDTDIPSATMDGFATRVLDGDERVVSEERFTLGDDAPGVRLPADYAIGPKGGDARRSVRVEVDALQGDDVLFGTHAVTSFRAERSLRLDMFLASRCLDEATTCRPGERCTERGCVPEEILPGDLPLFGADAGPGDGDPDGALPGEPFQEVWSYLVSGDVFVVDVAFDSSGDVFVAALYIGDLVMEDGTSIPELDTLNLLLLRYSRQGEVVWVQPYPAGTSFAPADLAMSAGGDLLLAGGFANTIDFGDGGHTELFQSAFLSRFSSEGGAHVSTRVFPSNVDASAYAVAVDSAGVIGIAGTFSSTFDPDPDIDGDELDLRSIDSRQFLVLLEDDGTVICRGMPDAPSGTWVQGTAIVFDGDAPRVGGMFGGPADFGAGPRDSTGSDGYVMGYRPDCLPDPTVDVILGGPGDPRVTSVTLVDGDLVVGGSAPAGTVIGGTGWGGFGLLDLMAVRYTGDPVVNIVGGSGVELGLTIVALPDSGDLLLGGLLDSSDAVFGGDPVEPLGPIDGVVARFDETAAEVGLMQIGGADGDASVTRLDYDTVRHVAAAVGQMHGEARLPGGGRDGGDASMFVLVFVP